MHPNLIPLNITIADRNYRIRIMPEDEEIVRRTLKMINDKIIDFRAQFAGKDMQDYIAMVLIWFATQTQQTKDTIQEDALKESLEKIEQQLLALDKK